jgi:hypothetical protein
MEPAPDIVNLLTDIAQILDVVKCEWAEAWTEFDQSCRDRITAYLRAFYTLQAAKPESVDVWQPIETAPRDGTWILVGQWIIHDGGPFWNECVSWWTKSWGFNGNKVAAATHWMPLPKPPSIVKDGGG